MSPSTIQVLSSPNPLDPSFQNLLALLVLAAIVACVVADGAGHGAGRHAGRQGRRIVGNRRRVVRPVQRNNGNNRRPAPAARFNNFPKRPAPVGPSVIPVPIPASNNPNKNFVPHTAPIAIPVVNAPAPAPAPRRQGRNNGGLAQQPRRGKQVNIPGATVISNAPQADGSYDFT